MYCIVFHKNTADENVHSKIDSRLRGTNEYDDFWWTVKYGLPNSIDML